MSRSLVLISGCVLAGLSFLPPRVGWADVPREKGATGRQMDAAEQLRGSWRAEDLGVTMIIRRPGLAVVSHDTSKEAPVKLSFSLRGKKILFADKIQRETYTFTFPGPGRLLLDGDHGTILFRRLK